MFGENTDDFALTCLLHTLGYNAYNHLVLKSNFLFGEWVEQGFSSRSLGHRFFDTLSSANNTKIFSS